MLTQAPKPYATHLEEINDRLEGVLHLVCGALGRGADEAAIEAELLNHESLAVLRTCSFTWMVKREMGLDDLTPQTMAKNLIGRAKRRIVAEQKHAEEESRKHKHDGLPNEFTEKHAEVILKRVQEVYPDYAEALFNSAELEQARLQYPELSRKIMGMNGEGPIGLAELTTALITHTATHAHTMEAMLSHQKASNRAKWGSEPTR